MLSTTRAIVLRTVKHSDSAVVAHVYTEQFGRRSCMVRAGGKNRARQAALLPLSRVELVVSEVGDGGLLSAREIRIDRPYLQLHTDPLRGAIALFVQEVFYRTLRADAPDPELFAFVEHALEEVDTTASLALLPQRVLIGLAHQLGFLPASPQAPFSGFDLREGAFFPGPAMHEQCMEPEETKALVALLEDSAPPSVSASVRRSLLERLLLFFRLHVEGFGEPRSVAVLHHVLH
mgnify:CR=1 FL=1